MKRAGYCDRIGRNDLVAINAEIAGPAAASASEDFGWRQQRPGHRSKESFVLNTCPTDALHTPNDEIAVVQDLARRWDASSERTETTDTDAVDVSAPPPIRYNPERKPNKPDDLAGSGTPPCIATGATPQVPPEAVMQCKWRFMSRASSQKLRSRVEARLEQL